MAINSTLSTGVGDFFIGSAGSLLLYSAYAKEKKSIARILIEEIALQTSKPEIADGLLEFGVGQ